MKDIKKLKAFCNRCNVLTNHIVKAEHNIDESAEINIDGIIESHYMGSFSYQIIECNGCDSITYRSIDFFPDFLDMDESTGKWTVSNGKTFENYFPERLENSMVEKRIIGIPNLLKRAYQEVLQCYNSDLRILCSAGLRAMIEGICNYYQINGQTLKDRIDALGKNGLISTELSKSLHAHRFIEYEPQ